MWYICLELSGECDFLGYVLLQQRFEVVGQSYSSVTDQFYLAKRESTPSPRGVRAG